MWRACEYLLLVKASGAAVRVEGEGASSSTQSARARPLEVALRSNARYLSAFRARYPRYNSRAAGASDVGFEPDNGSDNPGDVGNKSDDASKQSNGGNEKVVSDAGREHLDPRR